MGNKFTSPIGDGVDADNELVGVVVAAFDGADADGKNFKWLLAWSVSNNSVPSRILKSGNLKRKKSIFFILPWFSFVCSGIGIVMYTRLMA